MQLLTFCCKRLFNDIERYSKSAVNQYINKTIECDFIFLKNVFIQNMLYL